MRCYVKKMKNKFEIHITGDGKTNKVQCKGKGKLLLDGLENFIVSLLNCGVSVEMIMNEVTHAIERSNTETKVIKTDKKGIEQAIEELLKD